MAVKQITYVIEIDTANGKVKIDGLTSGFVKAETAAKRLNETLLETSKNAGQTASKAGLAGAVVTELGRTISDSNYGMMAMANNLQQLSTLFITLISTSGGFVKAIRLLSGAFMGPLGLIVAFQIFFAWLEKTDKKQRDVAASANKIEEAFKNAATELELLLKLDDSLTVQQKKNLEQRIELLKAEAVIRAQIAEIQKLQADLLREEMKEAVDFVPWYQALWTAIKTGSFDINGFDPNQSFVSEVLGIGEANKEKNIKEITDRINEIISNIDVDDLRAITEEDEEGERGRRGEKQKKAIIVTQAELREFEFQEMNKRLQMLAEARQQEINDENAHKEALRKIYEERARHAQIMVDSIVDGLYAMNIIAGEQTAVGKAFGVAGALIDTYAAIAKQLKAFAGVPIPGYAVAQAVATGLVGFAQVRKILSVQVPGGRGGRGSSGGSAPAPAITPSFNVIGQTGTSQLRETVEGALDRPLRAYVVQKDVRSGEELDRNTRRGATIG